MRDIVQSNPFSTERMVSLMDRKSLLNFSQRESEIRYCVEIIYSVTKRC